mgnify:CR=1 FL=1
MRWHSLRLRLIAGGLAAILVALTIAGIALVLNNHRMFEQMDIAAVARGERVTITKYGQPVAEINQPQRKNKLDFAAADRFMKEIGWEQGALSLPDNFDDPAFSRKVLGLED